MTSFMLRESINFAKENNIKLCVFFSDMKALIVYVTTAYFINCILQGKQGHL